MEIVFNSIGVIHTPYHTRKEVPKWGNIKSDVEGELVIYEQYLEGLADIHIGDQYQVIFHFHQSENYKLTVNIRGSGPMTGLFSTHSPNRPNGIGISVVTITKINGCHIHFRGVDMLDGTPLLDLKPYIRD